VKPGFCRKLGILDGIFNTRSGAGAAGGPGLRSAAAEAPAAADETSRRKRQVSFPDGSTGASNTDAASPDAASSDAAAPRSAAGPQSDDGTPNTRFFLPNPFGPGALVPNLLKRDECFNDFDCPGNLKCCFRDHRRCENPSFF